MIRNSRNLELRVTFVDGFQKLFDTQLNPPDIVFSSRDFVFDDSRQQLPLKNDVVLRASTLLENYVSNAPDRTTRNINIPGTGISFIVRPVRNMYMRYTLFTLVLNPFDIASNRPSIFTPVLQYIVQKIGPELLLGDFKEDFDFDIGVTNQYKVFLLVRNNTTHIGELESSEFVVSENAQKHKFKMAGNFQLDNHRFAKMVQFINSNSQIESPILDVVSNYPEFQINWDSCSVLINSDEQGRNGFTVTFFDPPRERYPKYPKPEQIEKVIEYMEVEMDLNYDYFRETEMDASARRKINRYRSMPEDQKVKCRYTKYRPVYEETVTEQVGDKRVKVTKEGGCINDFDRTSQEKLQDKMVFQTATGTCFQADDPDYNTPQQLRDSFHYHNPWLIDEKWDAAGKKPLGVQWGSTFNELL